MAVRERGRSWMADFMVAGKRYRETFDTKEQAEDWEADTRKALKRGQPLPSAGGQKKIGGKDVGTIGNLYRRTDLHHWSRQNAKDTTRAKLFVRWVGENVPAEEAMEQENIDAFFTYLIEERKVSDSTLNRYTSALSVMAKIGGLPKPNMEWRKARVGRKRYFTEDEVALIVQTLTLWGYTKERDFFLFLLDTGARPYSEAKALKWGDIRDDKFVYFGPTKNGNERTLPLTVRAQGVLKRRRAEAPERHEGPFARMDVKSVNKIWDAVRTHIPQLADTVVYTCRHTCASWQVIRGIDIRRVQVWMGHKSVATTLIYAHLSPSHLLDNLTALEGTHAPKLQAIEGGKVVPTA